MISRLAGNRQQAADVGLAQTVGIAADGQPRVVGYLHLHHGCLLIHDVLDGDDDLVNVFFVDLLAGPEALHHVVDKVLRHLVAKLGAVVVGLDGYRVDVQALGSRLLVANLDGFIELKLADDFLAFDKFQLGILVPRLDLDTTFEVLGGVFRAEGGGIGNCPAVVGLDGARIAVSRAAPVSRLGGLTLTKLGFSSIALVASAMA